MNQAEKKAICKLCPHSTYSIPFIGNILKIKSWFRCKICGCSIELKTRTYPMVKLKCPIDKWQ